VYVCPHQGLRGGLHFPAAFAGQSGHMTRERVGGFFFFLFSFLDLSFLAVILGEITNDHLYGSNVSSMFHVRRP
jgi:hypothetical protein